MKNTQQCTQGNKPVLHKTNHNVPVVNIMVHVTIYHADLDTYPDVHNSQAMAIALAASYLKNEKCINDLHYQGLGTYFVTIHNSKSEILATIKRQAVL